MISFKLEGAADLAKALEALGNDRTIKATMKRALLKRAQPTVAMAKSLAPKGTRRLEKSISASTQLSARQKKQAGKPGDTDQNTANVYIGSSDPKAHLSEFGTGPRYHKNGKYVGQIPPHPFVRPAWEATKHAILAGFGKDLGVEIEKAAKRISRKQARLLAKR